MSLFLAYLGPGVGIGGLVLIVGVGFTLLFLGYAFVLLPIRNSMRRRKHRKPDQG